jgi:SAM-dependent methyltransferase
VHVGVTNPGPTHVDDDVVGTGRRIGDIHRLKRLLIRYQTECVHRHIVARKVCSKGVKRVSFSNVYADEERAEAYAKLEFPGTYFLAFRDVPSIFAQHVRGNRALDFGCGTGRSTRFLKQLGFDATGIDISATMIERALEADPAGTYLRVENADFAPVESQRFDLIFSAFPFDNIPGRENRVRLLSGLRALLTEHGRLVLLGSTPEIYMHEWTSFTTKEFPENRSAKSGETVRIVMKDVEDRRPVLDLVWFHDDYVEQFHAAGLHMLDQRLPLGRPEEPYAWISETTIAPWVIYVLSASRSVAR